MEERCACACGGDGEDGCREETGETGVAGVLSTPADHTSLHTVSNHELHLVVEAAQY